MFLALRGTRPENVGSQDHILSKSLCKRLFNIFHPSDAVVSIKVLQTHRLSARHRDNNTLEGASNKEAM